MNLDKDWENKIRERLYDHSAEPPPFAWKKIDSELRPKRKIRWLIWLPVLLALIGGLPFILKEFSGKQVENGVLTENGKAEKVASENSVTTNQVSKNAEGNTETSDPDRNIRNISAGNLNGNDKIQIEESLAIRGNSDTAGVFVKSSKKPILPVVITDNERPVAKDRTETGTSEGAGKLPVEEVKGKSVFGVVSVKPVKNDDSQTPDSKTGSTITVAGTKSTTGNTGTSDIETKKGESELTVQPELKNIKDAKAQAAVQEIIENAEQVIAVNKSDENEVALPDSVLAQVGNDSTIAQPDSLLSEATEEKKEEQIENGKWSFTVFGSPQYTYRRVHVNKQDEVQVLKLNNQHDGFPERFGLELGLRANYNLTEKLKLEAGLTFTYMNERLNLTSINGKADSQVVSQNGSQLMIHTYSHQEEKSYKNKYYLGGVYLGASYVLQQFAHGNLQLTAGGNISKLLKAKQQEQKAIAELNQSTAYLSGGIRYSKPLAPGINLQIEPFVHYYFRSLLPEQEMITQRPVTIGLQLGFTFLPK